MTSAWRAAGRTAGRQAGERSSIPAGWARRNESRSPITGDEGVRTGGGVDAAEAWGAGAAERRPPEQADLASSPAGELVLDPGRARDGRSDGITVSCHGLGVATAPRDLTTASQPRSVLFR